MTGFPGLGDDKRRTVEESRIIDLLMLRGWPIEAHRGKAIMARQAAQAALDALIATGLAFRQIPSGQRMFDPVEFSNFLIWAGLNRRDPTFERHLVSSARRLVLESFDLESLSGNPPSLVSLPDETYRVTLRRRFNLSGYEPGKRIRLRLPAPLEGDTLTNLKVDFLPPAQAEVETATAPGQINLMTRVPTGGEITAGIEATFVARSAPRHLAQETLTPEEIELYTRPTEGMIRVTGRIGSLAERLAGSEQRAEVLLQLFWHHMINEYTCGSIHYDRLSPTEPLDMVLDEGVFDCRLGSALMIALFRARGIPARMLIGYMLNVPAPVNHTWLEVWIEGRGWTPIDFYCWGMTLDHTVDDGWRDFYLGRIDHRMVVERLPREYGGTGDVRLPPRWYMLNYNEAGGTTTEFRSIDSGALVYAEHVKVERLGSIMHPA